MAPVPGCKCRECWGLAELMAARGRDYGYIPPAPGHAPLPDPCDSTLTCTCASCKTGRTRLVQVAPKRQPIRQPWDPRPARRAA